MYDFDINRPNGRPRPFGPPNPSQPSTQPPRFTPGNPLDEARLEQEFGPPADGVPLGLQSDSSQKRSLLAVVGLNRGRASKKRLAILGAIGLAVVVAATAGAYVILQRYEPRVIPAVLPSKKYVPPKPTIVPSTLTGLPVSPGVNDRPVTGVMIENSIFARPQSGLDQAGVVFEAIAEGGITRFLALFQDTQPNYIGPVRSARFYYINWLLGFDAAYAHVGGSPEALKDIPAWHVKDLNEFYNAGAYHRISSRDAPHNVYTSIAELNALEKSKGFGKSNYTGFARKAKETPSKTPTVTQINMAFSGFYYNTHYDYDPATNTYKRSEGGTGHMELLKNGSRVRITPKVLVALVMPYSLEPDGYHSSYNTIGSGKMFVFQDGGVQTGTWNKASRNAQFTFTDTQGQPLKLDPGQTWISALKSASDVTYK
jgi:hypothetical protein